MVYVFVNNEKGSNYHLVLFKKWIKLPIRLKREDFSLNDCSMVWGISGFKKGSHIWISFDWKKHVWGKNIWLKGNQQ